MAPTDSVVSAVAASDDWRLSPSASQGREQQKRDQEGAARKEVFPEKPGNRQRPPFPAGSQHVWYAELSYVYRMSREERRVHEAAFGSSYRSDRCK